MIVEYPTGGGKTEGALWSAVTSTATSRNGFMFSLPTQATSNQMYHRVAAFLERCAGSPVPLVLQHGMAKLARQFDVQCGKYDVGAWFGNSKKAFLVPYGVGTVDQALLGILPSRYAAMRFLGMRNRTFIVDELHAYDAYTLKLLYQFLTWERYLNSSVIVLSATLTSECRRELLSVYGGRDIRINDADYPVLSLVTGGVVKSLPVEVPSADRRTVTLTPCACSSLKDLLVRKLSGGGCAAVIRNTVKAAQETYSALRDLDDTEVILIHSRFLAKDRAVLERTIMRKFGKNSCCRPARAVVVATQVLEQSLDVDFDMMVSDVAPLDILLQRAGRVQRHVLSRLPEFSGGPELFWLEPHVDASGAVVFADYNDRVYWRYSLLRAYAALSTMNCWCIPEDTRGLVDSAYAAPAPDDGADFESAYSKMLESLAQQDMLARTSRIASPEAWRPGVVAALGSAEYDDEDEAECSFGAAAHPDDAASMRQHLFTRHSDYITLVAVCLRDDDPAVMRDKIDDYKDIERLLRLSVKLPAYLWYDNSQDIRCGGKQCVDDRPWRHVTGLRRCRRLIFNAAGECRLGDYLITLDSELGAQYEKL